MTWMGEQADLSTKTPGAPSTSEQWEIDLRQWQRRLRLGAPSRPTQVM